MYCRPQCTQSFYRLLSIPILLELEMPWTKQARLSDPLLHLVVWFSSSG
jgi:hypothetical protein